MGGGASKQQLDGDFADRKDPSVGATGRKDASYKGIQSVLTESPFDDVGSAGDAKLGENDSPGKPVASATKLKRIALGQTTYMDQQRDYDQTLSKLDLNKSGIVDWIEPCSVSPSKYSAGGVISPFQSPGDAKFNTPPNNQRVRKPPPPSSKPSPAPVPVSASPQAATGGTVVHPTQQKVSAPVAMPSRAQQGLSRVTSPLGPGPTDSHGSGINNTQSHNSNFDPSFGQPHPHPHSHSFSTPQKVSVNPQSGVGHNQSGNQLMPRHNAHNQIASPSGIAGPPPGIISRPFPGAGHALDKSPSDADESMIADFTRSVKMAETFKKPDIVPILSIHQAAKENSGSHRAVTAGGPLLQQQPQIGRQNTNPNSVGQPIPRAAPFVAPVMYASGPALTAATHGQQQSQSLNMGSRPVTVGASAGPGPPGGVAPAASMTRPAPAPVPHGAGKIVAPVVKETKNVKRNRAQIPTQLAHALPTTGDWINKRYIVNNYILLEILGTGSYGEVRLCKDRTSDKLFAIKIFSKDFLKKKKNGKSDETFFEDIKREIAIMKKLLHPNVLRLFEVLDDPKVNKMYLVLEYMKMGDLINVLKSRGADSATNTTGDASAEGAFTPLTDMEVWNIFRQVVSGIRYLHYQNVVHGDIKPQNLLLGEDGLVKIADFGISQMLSASGQKLADAAGTPAFMSPELCEGKSFSGQLADIWAIGATMFMLRFGHPPFLAKSIINLYNKICHDPLVFPGPIDPGLKNLLENLLEKDPTKRYTLQQIIMHPWFRHPPSAHLHHQQQAQINARAASTNANTNPGPSASTLKSESQAADEKSLQNSITFKPPASYEADEEAAMKVPVKIDHNDEVYMSIGGIQPRGKSNTMAHSNEKIDEDNKVSSSSAYNSDGEVAEDMMGTDWGADVFQMVDDGDGSGNDDDDSVDDEDETVDASESSKPVPDSATGSKLGSMSSMMNTNTRTEMSQEEEEKRARRFLSKITKKSNENMALQNHGNYSKDSKDSSAASIMSPAKVISGSKSLKPSIEAADSFSDLSGSAINVKTTKLPFRAVSVRGAPRTRDNSIRQSRDEGEEETDELSMEDFNRMMDTLALQPKNFADGSSADNDIPATAGGLLPIDGFSVELANKKNGIAAAFNSEKGCRHTQEDRCVFLPIVSEMKGIEEVHFDDKKLELLSHFSIAAMFDGHSGWRCSQYLSQFFAAALVKHDRFLDKTPEAALFDVCAAMDAKVCDMLLDEEDASGSTGVVAVYDGRRHVLTVAGVGDSMCVLSRSGKAVMLNRMHRLDNADEVERIKRAGGTVINKRVNGLLAISRAFGDTQFKPEKDDDNVTRSPDGLVISTPEVCSEHITPMTEFAIMATDGLWDVMTPQMAVTFVRNMLHKHRDLEAAVKSLSQEALSRGSVDNVTVLIMSFHFSDEGKIKNVKH